jgi:hypothetical protein
MTADIFTIIGIIIAAVTLVNYYREKKKNLEYEVKKYFFDGTTWEFLEGTSDTNSNTAYHFSLHITNANFHSFVGEIKILEPDGTDSQPMDEAILFQFIGMNQGKISISIMKATDSSQEDLSVTHLGTAILEYENPQLFKIVFHESSLSKLPHTAFIMTKLISAPNSSNTQDIP